MIKKLYGKDKVAVVTLLDLSTAFDDIDLTILINRLSLWSGASGIFCQQRRI